MTEINNITKLELEIEQIKRIKAELDKGTSASNKLMGEILTPIIKALENVRDAIVEEQIIRTQTDKKADMSLEN